MTTGQMRAKLPASKAAAADSAYTLTNTLQKGPFSSKCGVRGSLNPGADGTKVGPTGPHNKQNSSRASNLNQKTHDRSQSPILQPHLMARAL
jgi:hypothetical protein